MRRRQLVDLTLAELDRLPDDCRSCVFWELDARSATRAVETGDAAFEKEAWASGVLLQQRSVGKVAIVDGATAGYALAAAPGALARTSGMPTSPIAADATALATIWVDPDFRSLGISRWLLQGVVAEAARAGIAAVEAFGWQRRPIPCLLPADVLVALGFRVVRPHPTTPRLRLDVETTLPLSAQVQAAVDRVRSALVPAGLAPTPGAWTEAHRPA